MESPEGAVHVGTARNDDATAVSSERVHERAGVVTRVRHHVHDDIGAEHAEAVAERTAQVGFVALDAGDASRQ